MWRELDGIVKPDACFATNTSSLPSIDQAAATSRPDRFLGLHFFNPAQVMQLVEVIRAVTTSDEAFQAGLDFGAKLGKQTRPDARQRRLHRQPPARALPARRDPRLRGGRRLDRGDRRGDEGGRRAPDGAAHAGATSSASTRIGAICDVLFDEFRERRFARPPLLRKMLSAGWYGRKSGMGFYDYSGEEPVPNPGI